MSSQGPGLYLVSNNHKLLSYNFAIIILNFTNLIFLTLLIKFRKFYSYNFAKIILILSQWSFYSWLLIYKCAKRGAATVRVIQANKRTNFIAGEPISQTNCLHTQVHSLGLDNQQYDIDSNADYTTRQIIQTTRQAVNWDPASSRSASVKKLDW